MFEARASSAGRPGNGPLTQREGEIFLRSGALLVLGLLLWGVNLLVTRREERGSAADAGG